MSPVKLFAHGLAGCRLARGTGSYRSANGNPSNVLAVTVSLLLAEPCLHCFCGPETISVELAQAKGYRVVRSYDEAVALGLL